MFAFSQLTHPSASTLRVSRLISKCMFVPDTTLQNFAVNEVLIDSWAVEGDYCGLAVTIKRHIK